MSRIYFCKMEFNPSKWNLLFQSTKFLFPPSFIPLTAEVNSAESIHGAALHWKESFGRDQVSDLPCLKQNPQRILSAVAGDRTACLCDVDLLKLYRIIHGLFYQIDVFLGDAGVGDEQQIRVDIRVSCKFVFYIFYEHFVEGSAVLLPHAHTSVPVVHLDAGLQLQHVRAQGGDGGAASACVKKGERVQDKAGVAFPRSGAERVGDGSCVHALGDHLSGGDHEKPGAGGKVPAVDDVDMAELLCGQAAVLIGTGKGVAQIDVDHLISVFHPRAEMVDVFLDVYRRGLGKDSAVVISLVNLLRRDVDVVFIVLSLQDDVERKVVYVVPFFQLAVKITGAVCADYYSKKREEKIKVLLK